METTTTSTPNELSNILNHPYCLWVAFLKENYIMHASEYEDSLKQVATIDSLSTFFKVYTHIKPPSVLPTNCELFFFKEGIKPVWENKHNRGGGKFILRVNQKRCNEIWEGILLNVLTWSNPALCGIVLNVKKKECVISIWTKELEYHSDKENIKDWIRKTIGIPSTVYIEYKEHPFTEDIAPLEKDWDNLLQIAKSTTFTSIRE